MFFADHLGIVMRQYDSVFVRDQKIFNIGLYSGFRQEILQASLFPMRSHHAGAGAGLERSNQGSTFFNGVLPDERQWIIVAKAAAAPAEPANSIINCVSLLAEKSDLILPNIPLNTTAIPIGTTLDTNAIPKESEAKCCLIHTGGFRTEQKT